MFKHLIIGKVALERELITIEGIHKMQHALEHLPFEGHVHVRQGAILKAVAPYTARQCWGGIVMPNTIPPIITPSAATTYKKEILDAMPKENFEPLMVGYLSEETSADDVRRGFESGAWVAMKFYPRGATTNSKEGINSWELPFHPALKIMEEIGMPLALHAEANVDESTGKEIDIYDRERRFIPVLMELRKRRPQLKISVEHGTSLEMAQFMEEHGDPKKLVCTVTIQHMMFSRQDLHKDGFQPHMMCYPIPKRAEAMLAWRELGTSGKPYIFAGTDSAPHPTHKKESACGCAGGMFTAHAMIPLYAQIFEQAGRLDNLEEFLCINGPRFYGLEPRSGLVTLVKKPWTRQSMIAVNGGEKIRPFGYHEKPEQRFRFEWQIQKP
ncbi:dihydroorotase [Candidatus Kaiserbacteria bacterium]|nr:MAG: dihydroorotase [Candidatus Kaiserbacteria bacterium]